MKLSLLIGITCIFLSCNKSSFLDVKPDQSISEPQTLEQLQSIIDNDMILNGGIDRARGVDPYFLFTGTDDNYLTSELLNLPAEDEFRKLYVWNDDIYSLSFDNNWQMPYIAIFYCNVVLDKISIISRTVSNAELYDRVKGSALFFRARFFYQLAQIFSPAYSQDNLNQPSIVLRLESDVNEQMRRSTVAEVYERIKIDLSEAVKLLPNTSESPYKTRPSTAAALAMLSKVSLLMIDYLGAKKYADSCLKLQSQLMDFNTYFNPMPTLESATPPIPRTNIETIFHSMLLEGLTFTISPFLTRIDSNLYNSYDDNDLRKVVFFSKPSLESNETYFKGSYDGSNWYFTGIAVDEIYLIRAECFARLGDISSSMHDLNYLMEKRWKNNGTFKQFNASNSEEAISIVLRERRKELIERGIRWSDLRRLNLLGANILVKRILGEKEYLLLPGDKRYTYIIPPSVTSFNPTMPQNPR